MKNSTIELKVLLLATYLANAKNDASKVSVAAMTKFEEKYENSKRYLAQLLPWGELFERMPRKAS